MTDPQTRRSAGAERLSVALASPVSSTRLQTAVAAGTHPDSEYVPILLARCAVEPDFYVRDTLTWALTRHPAEVTIPLLVGEVKTSAAQARSQALHTLSKIGDRRGWEAITEELLTDSDDEVARSAWRAAVVLVPDDARTGLARVFTTQLGRGGRDVQMSLSRAFVGLGPVADAVLAEAAAHGDVLVRRHAIATERLIRDPDEGFDSSMFEATRILALRDVPPLEPDSPPE